MTLRRKNETLIYLQEEIDYAYYDWLCALVDVHNSSVMVRHIHRIPFDWVIENDDNRCEDAIGLRDQFVYETQYNNYSFPSGDCSTFEVLVGIAVRMNDILMGIDEKPKIDKYFWEIAGNLGLTKYSDIYISKNGGMSNINTIVDRLINREYKANGSGGLFPLKRAKEDHRDVEIL